LGTGWTTNQVEFIREISIRKNNDTEKAFTYFLGSTYTLVGLPMISKMEVTSEYGMTVIEK
jgi:hypothetical protein